jgi:hypothetical protein
MSSGFYALLIAAGVNVLLAICWMSWRPKHHDALASMLGVERRGRPPIRFWKRLLKRLRIHGAAAGAGFYALSEIVVSVALALFATALSFSIAVAAIVVGQNEHDVSVGLNGQSVSSFADIALALFSHLASVKLHDGFSFTGLPSAELRGDVALSVLLLSLVSVVFGVGVKAMSEWFKCVWYAVICTMFPEPARDALERGEGGIVRALLGIEKAA